MLQGGGFHSLDAESLSSAPGTTEQGTAKLEAPSASRLYLPEAQTCHLVPLSVLSPALIPPPVPAQQLSIDILPSPVSTIAVPKFVHSSSAPEICWRAFGLLPLSNFLLSNFMLWKDHCPP